MFQSDYRREMDALTPGSEALERLDALLAGGGERVARPRRRFGRRCLSGALSMLLLLFDHFVAFPMAFLNARPFSFGVWDLLLVLWYALVLFYLVQEWRGMRRTCRRLELGVSAPLPPPRKMRVLKAAMDALCLAMWIILLALIIAVLPLLILEVPL